MTGVFDTLAEELPSLAGNLAWEINYGATNVVLAIVSAGLTGDYNQNGVVDAADYTVWRDSLGQTGTALAADGNGNDEIDPGDYDVWTTHFGESAGAGAHVAESLRDSGTAVSERLPHVSAVPEPATLGLLCLAAVACLRFRSSPVSSRVVPRRHSLAGV